MSGALGVAQDLQFSGQTSNLKTPNLLNYSGNLVLSAAKRSSIVPYLTGGIGGLTVFNKASLGINETQTFLTGNIGGGVKWFSGRWGLRGDYRLISVKLPLLEHHAWQTSRSPSASTAQLRENNLTKQRRKQPRERPDFKRCSNPRIAFFY